MLPNTQIEGQNQPPLKVSIITVVLNNAEYIKGCIDSVLGQTYPHIEYIVIDGVSTDGTLEIAKGYGTKLAHLISEKDAGIYHAMNKGLQLATGDVIGILNADDFYTTNTVIADVVATFNAENAGAVYADLQYVDRHNTDKIIRYWRSKSYKAKAFLMGWMPPHPTFFLKRKAYIDHGYFNTDLKSAADYELMLRMLFRYKITAAYLPQVTVKMRVGGKSNASLANRLKANKEDRLAWTFNGLKMPLLMPFLKPARKLSQFILK